MIWWGLRLKKRTRDPSIKVVWSGQSETKYPKCHTFMFILRASEWQNFLGTWYLAGKISWPFSGEFADFVSALVSCPGPSSSTGSLSDYLRRKNVMMQRRMKWYQIRNCSKRIERKNTFRFLVSFTWLVGIQLFNNNKCLSLIFNIHLNIMYKIFVFFR